MRSVYCICTTVLHLQNTVLNPKTTVPHVQTIVLLHQQTTYIDPCTLSLEHYLQSISNQPNSKSIYKAHRSLQYKFILAYNTNQNINQTRIPGFARPSKMILFLFLPPAGGCRTVSVLASVLVRAMDILTIWS